MCIILIEGENGPTLRRGPCQRKDGCPPHGIPDMLRRAGLRPTRQRSNLARLLFGRGDRHVMAEALHEEALRAGVPVSLATVYNTLNQFCDSGLVRRVAVGGSRTYFDTRTSDHDHFFVEGEAEPRDIPPVTVSAASFPAPPEGMEVVGVDVVIRLRHRAAQEPTGSGAPIPARPVRDGRTLE